MEGCIDPGAIQEGDLAAYVDGMASQAVTEHISRCATCAQQVEAFASLSMALAGRLYRYECPAPEQLIEYRQGELRGSEQLVVAQHLRQCPHCAREMAVIAREERSGLPGWARAAVQVLEGILVTQGKDRPVPAGQFASVRGAPGEARPGPLLYRADDVEIILSQVDSTVYPGWPDLTGLVHVGGQVPETAGEAKVELYRDGGVIALTAVSGHGQFTFAGLEPATYEVCLTWGTREIWLRGVAVA